MSCSVPADSAISPTKSFMSGLSATTAQMTSLSNANLESKLTYSTQLLPTRQRAGARASLICQSFEHLSAGQERWVPMHHI